MRGTELSGVLSQVAEGSGTVASASRQMTAQAEQVASGISGVATVAEVSASSASAQKMASSAAELALTAERLDELVSRFKLAVQRRY